MHLRSNWRLILRKAWSIRLLVVAGLLSALEVVLPVFENELPKHLFASLSILSVCAAFVARIIAQKDLS